jgi:hypothetical protein
MSDFGFPLMVDPGDPDSAYVIPLGERLELCFSVTSGEVFGSGDAGASWSTVATRLPPVFSVVAS